MEVNKESRSKTIRINAIITALAQVLQVLLGFVVRKVFIDTLGVSYLGYNSVFQNLLQMLNLADLGVGVAITGFLYKPLADNDQEHIASLMYIYKRLYNALGIIVLILGVVLSAFLGKLIPDAKISITLLRILFYINLAGTVSTYYLAYYRTLIIANQKSYKASLYDTICYFGASVAQCVSLLVYPNYIVYLVLNILKNVISNILVTIEAKKEFPKLTTHVDKKLIEQYKPQIYSYVKDVFVSRVGAYIYYSTDNVIISTIKGSLLVGYLSNYTLITTQVSAFVTQILYSVQATFGNYISSTTDVDKQVKMTDNYLCANYVIGNFSMLCVLYLIQPFIGIFFGKGLVLHASTAFWLSINLLLTILIQIPSQVFTIYKLFHYDRPIIIISASLNIIISIALVFPLGIDGALIGTFLTSLIYLYSRMYIISKRVYKIAYKHYLVILLRYWLISAASIIALHFLTKNIAGTTISAFILRLILVGLLAVLIPVVFLLKTPEIKFLEEKLIPKRLNRYISHKTIVISCIIVIVASIIIGGGVR